MVASCQSRETPPLYVMQFNDETPAQTRHILSKGDPTKIPNASWNETAKMLGHPIFLVMAPSIALARLRAAHHARVFDNSAVTASC